MGLKLLRSLWWTHNVINAFDSAKDRKYSHKECLPKPYRDHTLCYEGAFYPLGK